MPSLVVENVVIDDRAASIHCDDGRIVAIADEGEDTEVSSAADDRLDGRGCVVSAPLVNAHTHAAMTLFRGSGDDLPLMEWLRTRIWPYEKVITEEDVYAGTRLGILEMVRNGTVFFNDMYWEARGAARAVEEMGVRACIGAVFVDADDPAKTRERQAATERLLDELDGLSSRITLSVAPHAIYTVSEPSLRWAAELADARGALFHTHVSETKGEVDDCRAAHGCSPVAYLDGLGALGPRTVAAHTAWLSDDDVSLLGERKVVCVHNPVSNMKLAVGAIYPQRRLAAAGAVCAIGTDGAASNNCLDVFRELKVAALLQKFGQDDPSALPAHEALEMAIANPTAVFGLANPEIEVGRAADFILIDPEQPELTPSHSLVSDLVYSANGSVVDSVVCDGRVIMRHREIDGEEEIVAGAREAARRLFARVDG